MNFRKLLLATSLLATMCVSCVEEDLLNEDEKESVGYVEGFVDEPVEGLIGGMPFKSGEGIFKYFGSRHDKIRIDLFDNNQITGTSFTLCQIGSTSRTVYAIIPNETGIKTYTPGGNEGVFIIDQNSYDGGGAEEGQVDIISISETELIGRMNMYFDDENYVNGTFTLSFCN